jgi:hypothetical protein
MAKADEAAVATAKSDKPRTGGVLKRPDQTKAVKTKAPKQVKYSLSAMQDPEDMEIARLEKLLGVSFFFVEYLYYYVRWCASLQPPTISAKSSSAYNA